MNVLKREKRILWVAFSRKMVDVRGEEVDFRAKKGLFALYDLAMACFV